ncbi:MAG: amino acid ABC transporter substrate-binding protein [Ruminococcaceae bacterium]|nr:amino acid ABC transporter substrate-binding protein [Oscillospiraceae bacterium]
MKKLLAIMLAVVVVFCFAACGENAANNYAANNTEYFIGGTGPLTGDASSYGISVQNGAKLAVEKINANGGLNGVNFKFDIKDDQAAADKASTAYDQLFEAGMQISFGSVTSGSCEAFAAKAASDNLFFMTPSASADICIAEPNAFRVCFGDPDQGILAAQELTANFTKIGAIYDESDTYSSGIYEAFDAKMKELNVEYTTKTFNAENKLDFSTQVEALKDCDVIFLPIYYTEAGLIAKAAVAKGCDAVLFGCDGLDGVAGQIDETVTNTIKYITPFDVNSADANVAEFVSAYEAAYGVKPDQFAADGYDVVMAIYEAMKAAGVNDVTIDPDTLCETVKATITADTFSYNGVTGAMTWDASGAATKVPVIIELNK